MEIILGPPGTGKTTHLLGLVSEALGAGIAPNRIGYVAFTRKAASEAVERATARFKLSAKNLPYFRTLHSLAFKGLGLTRSQVMGTAHYREFASIMGIDIQGRFSIEEGFTPGQARGDILLFIESTARLRSLPLQEQWRETPEDMPWAEVDRIARGLAQYKDARKVLDFTDMIINYSQSDQLPELDLLVVDEAQDLSATQWTLVNALCKKSARAVVAGDDDQAIFRWAGADVEHFIKLDGDVTVLNQSYRIPQRVQEVADQALRRVRARRPKVWRPREEPGAVRYVKELSELDFEEGEWLILARNLYLLENAAEHCRRLGLVFRQGEKLSYSDQTLRAIKAWEKLRKGEYIPASDFKEVLRRHGDASTVHWPEAGQYNMEDAKREWKLRNTDIWHEALNLISLAERSYLLAALRRGESLTKEPRIRLSTIHAAKGGEAENVLLYLDISRKTWESMRKNPDDEARVFYVGATRAKKSLNIFLPRGKYYFTEL